MQNGGARSNAGRPKGRRNKKTLEKAAVAEVFNQSVMRSADRLFNAQLQLSLGSMMVYRVDYIDDDKGKPKRVHTHVTDPDEIKVLLDEHDGGPGEVDGSYYFFTDVPPDNRALDSMLNRGLGKPVEKQEIVNTAEVEKAVYAFNDWLTDNPKATQLERRGWIERFAKLANVPVTQFAQKVDVEIAGIQ